MSRIFRVRHWHHAQLIACVNRTFIVWHCNPSCSILVRVWSTYQNKSILTPFTCAFAWFGVRGFFPSLWISMQEIPVNSAIFKFHVFTNIDTHTPVMNTSNIIYIFSDTAPNHIKYNCIFLLLICLKRFSLDSYRMAFGIPSMAVLLLHMLQTCYKRGNTHWIYSPGKNWIHIKSIISIIKMWLPFVDTWDSIMLPVLHALVH